MESSTSIQTKLHPLVESVWEHFHDLNYGHSIVNPSMPILFFGNLDGYLRSPLRVVTVALNPSNAEFPSDNPGKRFPSVAGESGRFPQPDHDAYLHALGQYFETAPYTRWFSGSYRRILAPLRAGFRKGDGQPNLALHTDLFSCMATSPTWSGMDQRDREQLASRGIDLWHSLIEQLQPDVVLMSFAHRYLQYVRSVDLMNAPPQPSGRNGQVKFRATRVGNRPVHWVWGSASRKPFMVFNAHEKAEIGTMIRQRIEQSREKS